MIAMEYINHGFDKKYKSVQRVVLLLSGFALYFLAITVLNRISSFEGIAGLSYGAVLFGYAVVALDGKKSEFLMFSLLWVIIALVSAYIMFGILGIMTGEGIGILLTQSGDLRTYAELAAGALKFSMGRMVLAVYRRHGKKGATQLEDGLMAGTFFFLFVLVLGMFRLEAGFLSQSERYCLSLQLLGVVFGIVVVLSVFYQIQDKYRKEKLEWEYFEEEQKLQAEQIHDLYQFGKEVKHMRHDMKIKLDTIYRLMEKEWYEEAKKCVRKLGGEWNGSAELPGDTGNEGLNAALMKAAQRCRERQIKFHYVVLGRPVEIDSMDMGNLVDNLLKNGIEACEGVAGNGQVEIVIRKENGVVEIEVENTIKESAFKTNPKMKSQKKEKGKHGFGMKSIRKIIEQYHGEYICQEEKEDHTLWFSQSICLQIQKELEQPSVCRDEMM